VAVLPRQGEEFSKGEIAKSVIYVGHNNKTRREQIQYNWSIEKTQKTQAEPEDEETEAEAASPVVEETEDGETPQGSPVAVRRSPRRAKAQVLSKRVSWRGVLI